MNDKHWFHKRQEEPMPWEDGVYQTGSIHPPKERGGFLAPLLVAVIFLGGIASAMGLMNIHLFRQISIQAKESAPLSFSQAGIDAAGNPGLLLVPTNPAQVATIPTGDITVDINQNPISEGSILSLQDIYEQVIPSIVSISCKLSNGTSTGTGVVLSTDGYLVTNCHVVEDADTIRVQLSDLRILEASVVGRDAVSDLAVLHVQARNLTPAEFGDSGTLQAGDAVAVIGDSIVGGTVCAIHRDFNARGHTIPLIQTNVTWNSGSPLMNCYGQVVGIHIMVDADLEAQCFAVPSVTVKEIVDQLICQGYVSGRPTLGVTGTDVTTFYQIYYHLPQGIYITEVNPDSDAAAKDVLPGDILLSFDGARITDTETLKSLLYDHSVGDAVELVLYRSGQQYSVMLTLGEAKQ